EQGGEGRLLAASGIPIQQLPVGRFTGIGAADEPPETPQRGDEMIAVHDAASPGGRLASLIMPGAGAITYKISGRNRGDLRENTPTFCLGREIWSLLSAGKQARAFVWQVADTATLLPGQTTERRRSNWCRLAATSTGCGKTGKAPA